ncbi:MAG: element excision factor XisH family protein [Phormidesmis sp.]
MAKDRFHDIVKAALVKDGWEITHDPFELKAGGVEMEIDLGAERLLAAERHGQKIAVEVKSFLASTSTISEFHRALGQFINYRGALRWTSPDRVLYLAVPSVTYNGFFQLAFPKAMVEENDLKLVIYEVVTQEIVAWRS